MKKKVFIACYLRTAIQFKIAQPIYTYYCCFIFDFLKILQISNSTACSEFSQNKWYKQHNYVNMQILILNVFGIKTFRHCVQA